MITGITYGPGLTGNGSPFTPYINMSNPSAGMVRYNGTCQKIEVYDGSTWQQLGHQADVQLDGRTHSIIEWANRKMMEEEKLEKLIKDCPTVAKAKEHLDLVVAIAKEYKHE